MSATETMDSLEEFKERYKRNPDEIQRAAKTRRIIGFLSALAGLLIVGVLSLIYRVIQSELPPSDFHLSLILIGVVSYLLVKMIPPPYVLSRRTLAFHWLAMAIEEHDRDNLDAVRSNISKFQKYVPANYLPPSKEEKVRRYVNLAKNSPDEILNETFEDFFNVITRRIIEWEEESVDDVLEAVEEQSEPSITYREIIWTSLRSSVRNPSLWIILIVGVGAVVFGFVDKDWGFFIVAAGMPALQIYYDMIK